MLQAIYSLCVVTGFRILLSLLSASNLTKISLNVWFQKAGKVFLFKSSDRCHLGKLLQPKRVETKAITCTGPSGNCQTKQNAHPQILYNMSLTAHPGISQPLKDSGIVFTVVLRNGVWYLFCACCSLAREQQCLPSTNTSLFVSIRLGFSDLM